MPNKKPLPGLGPLPDPNNGNDKNETYGGANGLTYGTPEAAANSWIREGQRIKNANKTAYSYYKNLLAGWGVKPANKKQAKAIEAFVLQQASRAGANENPRDKEFQGAFIKKFWNAWVKSTAGNSAVVKLQGTLKSAFGDDWRKQVKGNKELASLMKKYVGSASGMDDAQLDALIKQSKTYKKATAAGGELQYLADFQKANGPQGDDLATQIASYQAYQREFIKTMNNYRPPNMDDKSWAARIAAEEQLFMKSAVSGEEFGARWGDYQANKQAYYDFVGEGLTDQDRQAILYGNNPAGQGMRDKLANVKSVNDLYQQNRGAYTSVMGGDLNANQKKAMLLDPQNRDTRALGRAGDVAKTIGQAGGSYAWMQGQGLSQGQKAGLLYEEGDYQQTYDALKRAFNVESSYSKSDLAGYGMSRSGTGAVTQNI